MVVVCVDVGSFFQLAFFIHISFLGGVHRINIYCIYTYIYIYLRQLLHA